MSTFFRAIALAALAAAPATAQEASPWSGNVALYGWALSLNGEAVVNGQPVDVDVSFDTIIENFDIGAMLEGSLYYKNFGVFGNLVYGEVSGGDTTPIGPTALQVGANAKITFFDFGLSYRTDPMPIGAAKPGEYAATMSFEPYVGLRYTSVDLNVDVRFARRGASLSDNIAFTDPIVGLRTNWDFTDRWAAMAKADIGGFGVGSDFSWNMMAIVGYKFGLFDERDGAAFFGYRALGQDYDDGSGNDRQAWDVVTHGPILGLNVRF